MSRIVLLLEEHSMKVLLEGLLPRLVPGLQFLCVAHEGKQDLEKSIPKKLRAWREPGVQFVVLRDNDQGDCRELKFQKVSGARRMAVRLSHDGNRSRSFQVLIEGIERLSTGLQASDSKKED